MQERKENREQQKKQNDCCGSDCLGMPSALSFQGLKLANFLETELTCLRGAISSISDGLLRNQAKDIVARSYSIFHEMGKLYHELGMSFLYEQTKKLVGGYGMMFVMIFEKWEQLQQSCSMEEQSAPNTNQSNNRDQVLDSKPTHRREVSQDLHGNSTKVLKCKKLGGISLYLETYSRNVDYDVQLIRELRERQETHRQNAIKKQARQADQQYRIEYENKLKEQILAEIDDNTFETDEIYSQLLARQKYINQRLKGIVTLDQIDEVVQLFKESENQAMQFLKRPHCQQEFYNSSEGFQNFQKECRLKNDENVSCLRQKVQCLLNAFASTSRKLENELSTKEQYNKGKRKKHVKWGNSYGTQTNLNYEEEIKTLHLKIAEQKHINMQFHELFRQLRQQSTKHSDNMRMQVSQRDIKIRIMEGEMEAKNQRISKLDNKMRILLSTSKHKDILINPLPFLQELNLQQKMKLIEEFHKQGLLTMSEQEHDHAEQEQKEAVNKMDLYVDGLNDMVIQDENNLKSNSIFRLRASPRKTIIRHSLRKNRTNLISNLLVENNSKSRRETSPVSGFADYDRRYSLSRKGIKSRRLLTQQYERSSPLDDFIDQSNNQQLQDYQVKIREPQQNQVIIEDHLTKNSQHFIEKTIQNTNQNCEAKSQASIGVLETVPEVQEGYQNSNDQSQTGRNSNCQNTKQQIFKLQNNKNQLINTSDVQGQNKFNKSRHSIMQVLSLSQKFVQLKQGSEDQSADQKIQKSSRQFYIVDDMEQTLNRIKQETVSRSIECNKQNKVNENKQQFSLHQKLKNETKNLKPFNQQKVKSHQKSQRTINHVDLDKRLSRTSGVNFPKQNHKQYAVNLKLFQLYKQFQDSEIRTIAQKAKNMSQFRQKVAKAHYNKCGSKCLHLNRYLQIFQKIIQQEGRKKRKQVKCPIVDLHENINPINSTGRKIQTSIKRFSNVSERSQLRI